MDPQHQTLIDQLNAKLITREQYHAALSQLAPVKTLAEEVAELKAEIAALKNAK